MQFFKLNDKVYDVLKWVTMVVLPALSTLYFALATQWGLPYSEEIVKTVMAVITFFGTILGISTAEYRKSSN